MRDEEKEDDEGKLGFVRDISLIFYEKGDQL